MEKILIADSGSTKTDWRLINADQLLKDFEGQGLNPDFHDSTSLLTEFESVREKLDGESFKKLFFYGSGASSEKRKQPIIRSFQEVFPETDHEIDHDLMGAARALHGDQKGLVGILGTGSNCCAYDGEKIYQEFRSGGYILNDEGGGVYLGKMIAEAFIRKKMEDSLESDFKQRYQYDVDDLLRNIYKEPFPNRFLAGFSRFALQHQEHPQIKEFIEKNFRDYFEQQVIRFDHYRELELGIVGSVAWHFRRDIQKVAHEYDVRLGKVLERPIDALVAYHQAKLGSKRS